MTTSEITLPVRPGPRPKATTTNPHVQLEQNAPVELQDRLRDYALSLPGVRPGTSDVSVPGTVACKLDDPVEEPSLPDVLGSEWGHIHPHYDGSLHLSVTQEFAEQIIEAGWGEYHCLVEPGVIPPLVIMLDGPRDEFEFELAQRIVEESYLAASGSRTADNGRALGIKRS